LRQQVREEAESLLADPTRSAIVRDPMVLADVEGTERDELVKDLHQAWMLADARWRRVLLLLTGSSTALILWLWPRSQTTQFSFISGRVMALVVLWILGATLAWGLLAYWNSRKPLPERGDRRRRFAQESLESALQRDTEDRARLLADQASIGGPDQVVRTLHLSSGGFDTIMHLGVARAL
jgi:hypothetical protein